MKKGFLLIILSLFVVSCGSSKSVSSNKKSTHKSVAKVEGLRSLESGFSGNNSGNINRILKDAEKYLGSPYKFGGTTSSGFDCSGYTLTVFNENNFKLPRNSGEQANTGNKIDVNSVKPGDLLFFATGGGSRVSHVGIVHDIGGDGEIKFIHASTSKGVIISSLNEKYWNKAFLHAQRVL
jgi:cell wall-associated NlpC family hydrolase